ncbi:hypothetical protein GGS23DRAFT_60765 [Durotheca rogersii]|uniref:uncharacterized protein n=1 Tax=Durotheca rogersii TaxID=419775 RepID=UPI00221EA9E2|nr:uncharacterized protein GGS23DRAFT_60765 [Durotheca rogersii]KAI5863252.1 hypothetical protein GGS23DRAFT_60765 [Durotheca rogersii]
MAITMAPEARGGSPLGAPETPSLVVSDGEVSPASDVVPDEEPIPIGEDDAQSIIQPSLSPAATRLTLPQTSAEEKAAAMERLPGGGLFGVIDNIVSAEPESLPSSAADQSSGEAYRRTATKASIRPIGGLSPGPSRPSQTPTVRFPSPWQAGPKQMVVQNESGPRPTLSSVFGQSRHRRSSSGGADALKRIRDAFPSMPSISLQSFFSGPSSPKPVGSEAKRATLSSGSTAEAKKLASLFDETRNVSSRSMAPPANRQSLMSLPIPPAESSALSPPSLRPRTVRRSTSDESMLYHSLSRVSSFGDDDRWNDTREQTNSRFKAITDSWDRPTFKLPQLPSIIPTPLKRNSLLGFEQSEASLSGTSRTSATFEAGSSTVKDDGLSDLDRALELLTGDVVIMGGYRGSVLRSTKTNRQVWVPVKVGLNIRKVNLEVGLDPEDEERMEESIYASGMLKNIGPIDISKRLFKRLRECENARTGKLRVWDYGYDWRLSPHLLSRKLVTFLEGLPSNQGKGPPEKRGAWLIAHSLGGIITRHAVNQRPELVSGVLYAGTPQRCINILGPFRNGDAVLFNEKVLTAQVNFSLRTSFIFLPEDGFCFINKHTGEQYPIDFFDPQEWAKYCLSPCVGQPLPAYKSRTGALSSLREFSEKLPTPLRSRGNSAASESRSPTWAFSMENAVTALRKVEVSHDRTLAPQMGTLQGDGSAASQSNRQQQHSPERDGGSAAAVRARNLEYLGRTLADAKRFRAETAHREDHAAANAYPPLAVIYGKEVPTVWAAQVGSREAIACSDTYDDLAFRSGDGVVLAREAMPPPGYEIARGGRVSTDRGHITMLGDLGAVGRALLAIVKGRKKGIGLGVDALTEKRRGGRSSEEGSSSA